MREGDADSASVDRRDPADRDGRARPPVLRVGLGLSVVVHAVLLAVVSFPPAAEFPDIDLRRWTFHRFEAPPEIEVPPAPAPVERPPEPTVSEVRVEEPDRLAVTDPVPTPSVAPEPPEVTMAAPFERPSVAQADVPPMLEAPDHFVRKLERSYPASLRRSGVGGVVELQMFVDDRGRVSEARVSMSSGHRGLDRVALEMADELSFLPALVRDRAVGVWVHQRICFVLLEPGDETPTPAECERRMAYSRG